MKPGNSFYKEIEDFLFFSTDEEFLCPYFRDRNSKIKAFVYYEEFLSSVYSILLPEGFRRIKSIFYKNDCEGCSECKPLRVRVRDFKPDKSQRRIIKKNSDIRVEIKKSEINLEKFLIYSDYVRVIHNSKATNKELFDEMECIHYGYKDVIEMDYFLENKLIGVGLVDECENALSSVYFYYDPACRKRKIGIFSIIKEIELAKKLGKEFLYLGYYIKDISRMSYKGQFKPFDLMIEGKWVEF
ncbi:MAG: arginyltransferase [Brevinematia bacterium]